ncbi:hypothetical protein HDG34_005864 [Paraburkholderia sp. HC6.4b]|uniref:hypothetical protein n=1 Tax=unclassified Paraburkholderia TaxID=2615204 RepID=UPI00160AE676|nr:MULTISPECIES: hypothetical protein [unclassified Paraburkholderia]MBB5411898.1 hypothetical protein [Paraburkholderia sp. HC6.4b]MBB5450210.1 hypothetical protein [Paraburkholderia sp. Kb1A]
MRFDGKTHKRTASFLKIGELSGVPNPAQTPARVTIMKGSDLAKAAFDAAMADRETAKAAILTPLWDQHAAMREELTAIAVDDSLDADDQMATMKDIAGGHIDAAAIALGITIKAAAPYKTEAGVKFPKSDYAYTPGDKPSEWKLRLTSTPGGTPDPRIVGAAVAALGPGGFRGNKVQIPAEDLAAVKARVLAAWRKANSDKDADEAPDILTKEGSMPDLAKQLADAQAELAKQTALASMNDAQKAYFSTLKGAEADAFIAAAPATREALLATFKAADEVVSVGGVEVRKSAVGDAAFALIKKQAADLATAAEAQAVAKYATMAGSPEYAMLPGDATAKAMALRAMDALPKAERDALDTMLKSGATALKARTLPAGHPGNGGTESATGAEAELTALTEQHMSKNAGMTYARAQTEVLKTAAGQDLYARIEGGE